MNVVNIPAELSREGFHHLFVRWVNVPLVNRSTAMAGGKLAQLVRDIRQGPTGDGAMAKIVKVEVLILAFRFARSKALLNASFFIA